MTGSHVAGWTSESPTPAQLKEFFDQIKTGRVTKDRLQAFLRGKADSADVSILFADWQEFYRGLFGIELDLSGVPIPKAREGFNRLIIVAPGITPKRLYNKAAELFPCWKDTKKNLDEVVVHSDCTAESGAYTVWFRDRVEADEELKNLSAVQLKERGIPGITLEERLLYELKYFKETGKHLDIIKMTLCSGSRGSYGSVPRVDWNDGGLDVFWYRPDFAFYFLRSRAAVR